MYLMDVFVFIVLRHIFTSFNIFMYLMDVFVFIFASRNAIIY